MAPDGRNVHRLLAPLEGRNIPVMIHWEVYDWARDWPAFDRCGRVLPEWREPEAAIR